VGDPAIIETLDALALVSLLPELPTDRTRLLDNLGRVRREVGPITPELSDALADHMNVRRGEVHEVVSFYSFLQVPVDIARVCTGPVCDWPDQRHDGIESANAQCTVCPSVALDRALWVQPGMQPERTGTGRMHRGVQRPVPAAHRTDPDE